MTDEHQDEPSVEEENDPSGPKSARDEPELPGGVQLNELMRRAFRHEAVDSSVDVLSRVQDQLSERSGGKFYADGWSRTKHPPFSTFFITSLMMLAVVAIIYAMLVPLVGEPIELPPEPKPVQILH